MYCSFSIEIVFNQWQFRSFVQFRILFWVWSSWSEVSSSIYKKRQIRLDGNVFENEMVLPNLQADSCQKSRKLLSSHKLEPFGLIQKQKCFCHVKRQLVSVTHQGKFSNAPDQLKIPLNQTPGLGVVFPNETEGFCGSILIKMCKTLDLHCINLRHCFDELLMKKCWPGWVSSNRPGFEWLIILS